MKVENYYSWIKQYSKINMLYEKTIGSYKGLLMLASARIIYDIIS